jgi:pimeloyl-ACP methyl ester carboxylesterase
MSEPKTHLLEAPGAVLCYDVRYGGDTGHPVLLMIGSPMGAAGFAALAEQFADRTVVTYDPRGSERSKRTDGQPPGSEPGEHAEDLRRLLLALDAGRADVFASSGGAVNALALVAAHPALIRTLVAHEPPAATELPDRAAVLAACASIRQTYQSSGFGPAMAGFIALVSHAGPIPPGFGDQPGPDPAAFGLPAADDGSRNDPLLGPHMTACRRPAHRPGQLSCAPAGCWQVMASRGERGRVMGGHQARD